MKFKPILAVFWILAGALSACMSLSQTPASGSTQNPTQGESLFVKSVLRPPIYGVSPGGWTHRYLLLLKDGTAFKDLPTGIDMSGVTRQQLIDISADKVGVYVEQGNSLEVSWNDRSRWVFFKTPKGWQRQGDDEAYRHVPPLSHRTLRAAYLRESSALLGFGPDPATAVSSSRFTFLQDGRFILDAFSGGTGQGAGGVLEARYVGNYSFEGYGLNLQFDDGTRQFETAFIWSDDGDSIVSLGKRLYEKTPIPRDANVYRRVNSPITGSSRRR